MRGGRNPRHGQSAAAPVLTTVPLGDESVQARRSRCASALPRRREPACRLAAQRCAGAVQRRRCLSHCTDRSTGGCAARRTLVTIRVRALRGPDAAEASPRRRVSWRSRGRWWRGPSARATERPCRLSAVPAGPLTPVRRGRSAHATREHRCPAEGHPRQRGSGKRRGNEQSARTV